MTWILWISSSRLQVEKRWRKEKNQIEHDDQEAVERDQWQEDHAEGRWDVRNEKELFAASEAQKHVIRAEQDAADEFSNVTKKLSALTSALHTSNILCSIAMR